MTNVHAFEMIDILRKSQRVGVGVITPQGAFEWFKDDVHNKNCTYTTPVTSFSSLFSLNFCTDIRKHRFKYEMENMRIYI